MIVAKVIGSVVSTLKHDAYRRTKLMVVQPLTMDLEPKGSSSLAVDTIGAGEGDTVLVVREGASASRILGVRPAPVRSLIVGLVDSVDISAHPNDE